MARRPETSNANVKDRWRARIAPRKHQLCAISEIGIRYSTGPAPDWKCTRSRAQDC
jgi:hypothetical protein